MRANKNNLIKNNVIKEICGKSRLHVSFFELAAFRVTFWNNKRIIFIYYGLGSLWTKFQICLLFFRVRGEMHKHTNTHIHIHTYTHTYTHTHTHKHTQMHTHAHTCTRTHAHTHAHAHAHAHEHAHTQMHMQKCTHKRIHTSLPLYQAS